MQIFGTFFYIRPADPILNQLLGEMCRSSNPARLPGGATENEGLARTFRSCLDVMPLSGQEKGRCDFKQDFLMSVEELQAFLVLFGPVIVLDIF